MVKDKFGGLAARLSGVPVVLYYRASLKQVSNVKGQLASLPKDSGDHPAKNECHGKDYCQCHKINLRCSLPQEGRTLS